MKRFPALLATMGLMLAAGCGSDDETSSASTAAPATAATEATAAADATVTTDATEATTEATTAASTESGGAFPVTIENKFGQTVIPEEPERVVSVGYSDQDFILALGVQPVGIREWYGEQPYATWPWAQDELGDAEPTVLDSTEIDLEAVAALEPDLIVGMTSGMTEAEYESLSQIAPTLAQSDEYIDYGVPWDVVQQTIGDALGKSDEATGLIDGVAEKFAAARAAHPEFEGATASVSFFFEDQPGAYASSDSRSRLMTDLGFVIPEQFDELAGDAFYFSVSQEELPILDTDVLLWITSSSADIENLAGITLRPTLRAYAEGREVLTTDVLAGAFSFGSPLSLEYLLDELVPELVLAVDGDPSTVVPSAAALEGGAVTG